MIHCLRHSGQVVALLAALGGLTFAALKLRAATEAGGAAAAPQAANSSADRSRTGWDYMAYRITAFVEFDPDPERTSARRAAVLGDVENRARALVGGLWQLKALEAPAELHWNSAADIERVTENMLPATAMEGDKVFLIGVGALSEGRRRLFGREIDVRTGDWSATRDALQDPGAGVAESIMTTIGGLFRYLARIDEINEQGNVVMRVRSGGLPVVSPSRIATVEERPYRPFIRHFDSAGRTVKNGVFPIDWTWLKVDGTEGAVAKAQIVSGVADPLELKFDGRTEYLALAAPLFPNVSTDLVVRARGNDRPLEDVEVFAKDSDQRPPLLIGRTNAEGVVKVVSRRELETILIRSGDDLLAQFPLVPGFQLKVVAHVDDNGRRLESGALVDRLNDELLDLAVQQSMLKARFQRQVVHGNLDEAQKTLAALKSLKSSDAFLKAMDSQRADLSQTAADQAAADWLDKQLGEIKPLAAKFLLDAQGIARLESVLASVRAR